MWIGIFSLARLIDRHGEEETSAKQWFSGHSAVDGLEAAPPRDSAIASRAGDVMKKSMQLWQSPDALNPLSGCSWVGVETSNDLQHVAPMVSIAM
jgi:hypothetical protein